MGQKISKPEIGEACYDILAQTSEVHLSADTLNSIYIQLVGKQACTEWIKLKTQYFKKLDECTIVTKDIGAPILLNIELREFFIKDEWYPDYVTITYHGEVFTFPIYDWVHEKISVERGQVCLPQNVTNNAIATARKEEIEKNREIYIWEPKSTMLPKNPRYCSHIPDLLARTASRQEDIAQIGLTAIRAAIIEKLENIHNPLDEFSDFENLFQHYEAKDHKNTPNFLKDWQSDVVMGRQVLTGIAPNAFSQCREIPSYFNVTSDDVKSGLNEKSLDDELKAARLYICDFYELLKDLPRNLDHKCANAVGLFYMNNKDDFVPIAIQLVPGDRDYLFTPNDSEYDWLLAKLHFRCALTSVHQWHSHYVATHAICEPFAISLFRCFPRSHPVYKLLRPHLRTVPIINNDARRTLINPGGFGTTIAIEAAGLGGKVFDRLNVEDMVLPKLLKKLGTDSPNLKKYYYREDGLKVWEAIEKYVSGIIKLYYLSDKSVGADFELQGWCREMAQEGLGWKDGNPKGMPEKLTSIDRLIEICTSVIFTSSTQHAAVNFGQLDTYKLAPNSPGSMRELPCKKGEATKELVFKTLPTYDQQLQFIAIIATLSIFSKDEKYLGQFQDQFFYDEEALQCQKEFSKDLSRIQDEIEERNKNLEVPYIYLLPNSIPNSIAI